MDVPLLQVYNMIRIAIIAVFGCLFLGMHGYAQTEKLNEAIDKASEGNLEPAKQLIDEVAVHLQTSKVASTWYYREYIYKKLYTENQEQAEAEQYRAEAVFSLRKFLELENRADFEESAKKMGAFLASTYYNDAVKSLRNDQFDLSNKFYNDYKSAIAIVEPQKEFDESDIKFRMALASGFMNLYESKRSENERYFSLAKQAYVSILESNPENWNANYNLAILLYNRAVTIIKTMDYDTDIAEVDQVQLECVKLFFESLPYMQRAHELNPHLDEPIVGLTGIYYSLHEDEQYQLYKSMLSGDRH